MGDMDVKLAVYEVGQCGYYERGGDSRVGSSLTGLLSDIHSWISPGNVSIEHTKTFEKHEHGLYLPTYCFDIAKAANGDFLLTTWNETPADEGTQGSVGKAEKAGSADVQATQLPANSIPGYGTHFWFLPIKHRVVTVRFESQPLNGHQGMRLFMQGYLERFSPHVRLGPNTDEGNVFTRHVLGYARDGAALDADPENLVPKFHSGPIRNKAELDFIKENREKISNVIRKGRPSGGGNANRNLLDKLMDAMFGSSTSSRTLPEKNFRFELAYQPTEAELTKLFTDYETELVNETWEDIGFKFTNTKELKWMSSSTLKLDVAVGDALRNGPSSLASAAALLAELHQHRDKVLV
jgi:hypothetical protein